MLHLESVKIPKFVSERPYSWVSALAAAPRVALINLLRVCVCECVCPKGSQGSQFRIGNSGT